MTKLNMHTPDGTNANVTRIAELFPTCLTEAKDENGTVERAIDFNQLRQELADHVVDGPRERYHLDWPGKRESLLAANAPIAKTLRPCREESTDFESTKNLFIEGDNLDTLKLLQETYLNSVAMIYIDPPYNTGADLIYDDDFSETSESYLLRSQQKDESGRRLVLNAESNGRFHSDWLSMLYPRVRLARNLLADHGVLCISIGDAELANTRAILAEVFGETNYINTISVLAKVAAGASGGGEDKRLKKNIEHVIVFAKRFECFNTLSHLYTERPLLDVIKDMREEGESWKYTSILLGANPRVQLQTITDGEGTPIKIYRRTGVQRTTIAKVCRDQQLTEGDAYQRYFDHIFSDTNAQTSIRTRVMDAVGNLGDSEILEVEYVPRSGRDKGRLVTHSYISNTVRRVIWLSDVASKSDAGIIKKEKLGTLWADFDYNNVGKEGGVPFPDGKKPIDLIRTCIKLHNGNDGVFLDFFAGSCSFAHAVMRENIDDHGTRRFIVVQLAEELDVTNTRYDSARAFYEENGIPANVAEIGKERIRRAGRQLKAENALTAPNLDIGFRVLKVDTSNMKDLYYQPDVVTQPSLSGFVDNIKDDRTDEDLLFQVLLDRGLGLTLPITAETIKDKTVYFVDTDALAACFETGIDEAFIKELAKRKPVRAVFRDTGYGSDATKINVEQIFKLLSPATEVKSI
jgi:adenine-specific DNA-methyltransferase